MSSFDALDALDHLIVLLEGRPIGSLSRSARGLRLTFDDDYLDDPESTALSAAMPPTARDHGDGVVAPWLWGLLPDNTDVLRRWGRALGVSVASPFSLLSTPIGHDCAGAVQFAAPHEVDDLLDRPGHVEPLTEGDVAVRLRLLRSDSTSWLGPGFTGQFSLGGAQAKTALWFDGETWGEPVGAVPTTHILKPAVAGLDGHDLNEHLCLTAARGCGLLAARTQVCAFEDQTEIVVDRYDRVERRGRLVRIHQEDLCQAMGLDPSRKYQAEGGPSVAAIASLLRSVVSPEHVTAAIDRFVDALAFNWIIGGTDAHAKNYSLVHSRSQTRLAPLYDVASALPYDASKGHKLKMAMRLGPEYRLLPSDRRSTWERVAVDVGLTGEVVHARVAALVARVGEAFADAADDPAVATLGSDLPTRLVDAVAARAQSCASVLG